jgi:NAD/NADP transhydrogenase beta subunit
VTFTGSIVAFLKLAGRMSSKPLLLPARHLVNAGLLGGNFITMGAFLAYAPAVPLVGGLCLIGNALLSFMKGYTLTATIGGADMRQCPPIFPSHFSQLINIHAYSGCDHCTECIFSEPEIFIF